MNKFEFDMPNEEYFFPCCLCKNKRADVKGCNGYNLPSMKEYDMISEIKEILEKGINKE